jgi:transcriptional regulator with XRE-family HTH domain
MTASTRTEFGDFLRSRRERLNPDAMGVHSNRRRRTPGLRREEVAEMAGIGVDWYVRLEQGRTVRPSEATLDALVGALRLGTADAAHLRALARKSAQPPFTPEKVPSSIVRMVTNMNLPAYVTGRRWDILLWNTAAAEILGFDTLADSDRNILIFMFTGSDARRLFGRTWTDEARRMIARFRPTYDLHASDPAFIELVDRLRSDSPEFSKCWNAHEIRNGTSGNKVLVDAKRGAQRYEYATFQANDDASLKLSIYTPV